MYDPESRFDYNLTDAFQCLGFHLYGKQWNGNEIRAWKHYDTTPKKEELKPIQEELDRVTNKINKTEKQRLEIQSAKEIQDINSDLHNLRDLQNQLYSEIHAIGYLSTSNIQDSDSWKRFEKTRGTLLQGLIREEIKAFEPFGLITPKRLWAELPKGIHIKSNIPSLFISNTTNNI